MSFKLLKQVIALLRQKAACPECRSRFTDDSIFVLSTTAHADSKSCLGLFFVVCPKCLNTSFVLTEVTPHSEKLTDKDIRMETKSAGPEITHNDVLDMHNFLKNWKGDLKELFQ